MIGALSAALFSFPAIVSGTVAPQPYMVMLSGCSGTYIAPRTILTAYHCSDVVGGQVYDYPSSSGIYTIVGRADISIESPGFGLSAITVDREMARETIPLYIGGGAITEPGRPVTLCGYGGQGVGSSFPQPASCGNMINVYRWWPNWMFSTGDPPSSVQGGDSGGVVRYGGYQVGVIVGHGAPIGTGGSWDDLSYPVYRDWLLETVPGATFIRGLAFVPGATR